MRGNSIMAAWNFESAPLTAVASVCLQRAGVERITAAGTNMVTRFSERLCGANRRNVLLQAAEGLLSPAVGAMRITSAGAVQALLIRLHSLRVVNQRFVQLMNVGERFIASGCVLSTAADSISTAIRSWAVHPKPICRSLTAKDTAAYGLQTIRPPTQAESRSIG